MDLFTYLWCIKTGECRWTLLLICKSHGECICEMLFMYHNLRHSLKVITSRLLDITISCNPGTSSCQREVSMTENPNCIAVQRCRRGRDSDYEKMHLCTWKWQRHANNAAINQLQYMTQFPATQIAVNVNLPCSQVHRTDTAASCLIENPWAQLTLHCNLLTDKVLMILLRLCLMKSPTRRLMIS